MGRLKVGHWEIRLQLDGEVGGQNRDKAAVRYKCGGKWMDRPHLALAQRKQLGNAWLSQCLQIPKMTMGRHKNKDGPLT